MKKSVNKNKRLLVMYLSHGSGFDINGMNAANFTGEFVKVTFERIKNANKNRKIKKEV